MTHPTSPGAGDPLLPPPDPLQSYPAYPPYQGAPAASPDRYPPQQYGPPPGHGYGPTSGYPYPYPYDYGYGYGAPYSHPGHRPPRTTDGMAIASLVVSCASVVGLCTWGVGALLGVLGAILGHVARRRIRTSGAGGEGIALAGIIVGWTMAAIAALLVTLFVVLIIFSEDPSSTW